MTAIIKSYHTHAQGEEHGWFAVATHPVHLDAEGEPIQGTEWQVRVDKAPTFWGAVNTLEVKVSEKLQQEARRA